MSAKTLIKSGVLETVRPSKPHKQPSAVDGPSYELVYGRHYRANQVHVSVTSYVRHVSLLSFGTLNLIGLVPNLPCQSVVMLNFSCQIWAKDFGTSVFGLEMPRSSMLTLNLLAFVQSSS